MFAESPTRKRHYEETSHATARGLTDVASAVCQQSTVLTHPSAGLGTVCR